jgi:hypothetical protein
VSDSLSDKWAQLNQINPFYTSSSDPNDYMSSGYTPMTAYQAAQIAAKKREDQIRLAKEAQDEQYRQIQMAQTVQTMQHQKLEENRELQKQYIEAYNKYYQDYMNYVESRRSEYEKEAGEVIKAISKKGGLNSKEQSNISQRANLIGSVLKGAELLEKRPNISSPEQVKALFEINKESSKVLYNKLKPGEQQWVYTRLVELGSLPAEERAAKVAEYKRAFENVNLFTQAQDLVNNGQQQEAVERVYARYMSRAPKYDPNDAAQWVQSRLSAVGIGQAGEPSTTSSTSEKRTVPVGGYLQTADGKVQFVPGKGASADDVSVINKFNTSPEAAKGPKASGGYGDDPEYRQKALDYFQQVINRSSSSSPKQGSSDNNGVIVNTFHK